MLLSLDLHKAFDALSLPYLFAVLQHWKFSPNFLWLLHTLIKMPASLSMVIGQTWYKWSPDRTTCPLSTLLIIIAIETLPIHLNPNIQSVQNAGTQHKRALFADYLLLFVTLPITTLISYNIGVLSGLHVNLSKLEALNITLSDQILASLKTSCPLMLHHTEASN